MQEFWGKYKYYVIGGAVVLIGGTLLLNDRVRNFFQVKSDVSRELDKKFPIREGSRGENVYIVQEYIKIKLRNAMRKEGVSDKVKEALRKAEKYTYVNGVLSYENVMLLEKMDKIREIDKARFKQIERYVKG